MDTEYQKPKEIEERSMQIIESEMTTRPPRYHAPVVRRVIHATADFDYERNLIFSETAVASALAALRGGRKNPASGSGPEKDTGKDADSNTDMRAKTGTGTDTGAGAGAGRETGGAIIVTDTNMALAGINKGALKRLGCRGVCHMADPDVAEEALRRGITRAAVSMEKAARAAGPELFSPESGKSGEFGDAGQKQAPRIFAVGNAPTALLRLKELIGEGAVRPALVIGVPVGFVNVVESKELIMTCGVPYIVARGRKGGSTVAAAICNALLYMAEDSSY